MTAREKLAIAAHLVGFATPTAVLAFTEYETHHGAVLITASLVAGAAALVALSAADGHAEEVARLKAQTEAAHDSNADAPPAARTPLFEQPPAADHDRGYAEGIADGYHRGWADGYQTGYRTALTPSTARHAAETTAVDLTPVDDTVVMGVVTEETAEQLAAKASDEAETDGDGFEGFFTAVAARQAASAA